MIWCSRTLRPILWDFECARMSRMSCWHDDHRVVWQGMTGRHTAAIHAMEASDLMLVLLEEFKDVFTVPSGLPPPHRHNHRIHLFPDTPPIAVRPYRYP
jgi:thiamine pyrophosphate-dependent acetolactate synthase large subunit-like protein